MKAKGWQTWEGEGGRQEVGGEGGRYRSGGWGVRGGHLGDGRAGSVWCGPIEPQDAAVVHSGR